METFATHPRHFPSQVPPSRDLDLSKVLVFSIKDETLIFSIVSVLEMLYLSLKSLFELEILKI